MPRAPHHVAWWLALGLLLLNDHLLKNAGVLPGWLTGKLSDVAGLVVAPAAIAWLLQLHRAAARACAGLAVGVLFTLINLSPIASEELVAGAARFGLAFRLWPDPTDLLALAALPFGVALAAPTYSLHGRIPWARSGLLLACWACIASSGDDSAGSTGTARSANVENGTDTTLRVVVASTEGAGGCDLYTEDRISILTDDAFAGSRVLQLDPGDRVPISQRGDCSAARLQLPDGKETRFFWTELAELEGFLPRDDPHRLARTAVIQGEPDNWRFQVGRELTVYDPKRRPPDTNCSRAPEATSLEWTPLPVSQGFLELEEVAEDADGCLVLTWATPMGEPAPDAGAAMAQTLCAPDWAFPFEAGDRVSVIEQREGQSGTLHIARQRGDDGEVDAELAVSTNSSRFEDDALAGLHVVECFGALSPCGAYLRPVEVELRDGQRLQAGEESDLEEPGGNTTQVLIGYAFDVGWSGRRCEGPEASTGSHASTLVLRRR